MPSRPNPAHACRIQATRRSAMSNCRLVVRMRSLRISIMPFNSPFVAPRRSIVQRHAICGAARFAQAGFEREPYRDDVHHDPCEPIVLAVDNADLHVPGPVMKNRCETADRQQLVQGAAPAFTNPASVSWKGLHTASMRSRRALRDRSRFSGISRVSLLVAIALGDSDGR